MAASDPDCDFIHRTAVLTLETATDRAGPSRWSNARTGRSGTLTIIATEVNKAGERCRRFETTLQGPKLDVKATGTACFSENQWRMSGWHEYTKKTREP
jgi:surface antigen